MEKIKEKSIRYIQWMRLKHTDTGETIEISFEQDNRELYVPDDNWSIEDSHLVTMWD